MAPARRVVPRRHDRRPRRTLLLLPPTSICARCLLSQTVSHPTDVPPPAGTEARSEKSRTCFCCIMPSNAAAVAGFIPEASMMSSGWSGVG